MGIKKHYDRKGNEISVEQFRTLFHPGYYQVARTQLGATLVNTMWLGVNHARYDNSPPEIFQTFIASPDPRYADYMRYYATEQAARSGHRALVARIRRNLPLL